MRFMISLALSIGLLATSSYSAEKGSWFKINKNNGAVERIDGEKPSVSADDFQIMSSKDYEIFKKFLKEMNKPPYAKMSDEQRTKSLAKKFGITVEKMDEIYLFGTVVEKRLGPDEMKSNNTQASSKPQIPPAEQDYAAQMKDILKGTFPSVDVHLDEKPMLKWMFVSVPMNEWFKASKDDQRKITELLIRGMRNNLDQKSRLKVSIGAGKQNLAEATWSALDDSPTIEIP